MASDGTFSTKTCWNWQAEHLVIRKEKCPVLAVVELGNGDRATEEGPEIVHDQLGHGGAERIAGGEVGVLVILENAAMILIAAAFGDRRDVADAAEFRSVVDLTYTDLLDSIERWETARSMGALLRGLMVLMPSMLMDSMSMFAPATEILPLLSVSTPGCVVRVANALVEPDAREPSATGKIDQLAAELGLGDIRNLGVDGSLGLHIYFHRLSLRRQRHRTIDADCLPRQKLEIGVGDFLETRHLHGHLVVSRLEIDYRIITV